MEIKNIGLTGENIAAEVIINKIKNATGLIPPKLKLELGEEQTALPKSFLDISLELLKFFRAIREDFDTVSLLSNLKELLASFSFVKEGSFNQEAVNLINKIKAALIEFKDFLSSKEFSAVQLRNILNLHVNSQDLREDLAKLISILNGNQAKVPELTSKLENFVNYLEALSFLNQGNISNDFTKPGFLYFPFSVTLENNQDAEVELLIYPRIDEEENKVNPSIISFALNIQTQSLGRMGLFFKIINQDVSCNIAVEKFSTKEIIEGSKDYLAQRLKEMKFTLANFGAKLVDSAEEFEKCLFSDLTGHLELKA